MTKSLCIENLKTCSLECFSIFIWFVDWLQFVKKGGSDFYRMKAAGEEAVRSEFPNAIVFRPSDMFGFDDSFLHYYAARSARVAFLVPFTKSVPLTNQCTVIGNLFDSQLVSLHCWYLYRAAIGWRRTLPVGTRPRNDQGSCFRMCIFESPQRLFFIFVQWYIRVYSY